MGVEERALAGCDAALGLRNQRAQEAVNLVRLAVVRVQGHQHVVLLGKAVHRLSQHDRTRGGVFHRCAGGKLAAAQGNLDDTIGLGLGKRLEGAVDDLDGGDVHGRVGIALLLCRIEHLDVLFLCRYRHGFAVLFG